MAIKNSRYVLHIVVLALVATGCGSGEERQLAKETSSTLSESQTDQAVIEPAWKLEPYDESRDTFDRSSSFDDYFEPLGVLSIPDDILVGQISSVDVDDNDRLLIVDVISKEVYLTDEYGVAAAKLDSDACHPGYSFAPLFAVFESDGQIVVASDTLPSGFRFRSDGTCIGAVELGSGVPNGLAAIQSGVVVYQVDVVESEIVAVDSVEGNRSVRVEDEFGRLNYRIGGMQQFVAVGDSVVALTRVHTPTVTLAFVNSGKKIEIGSRPANYKPVERDISDNLASIRDIFADLSSIIKGKTQTIGLRAISDTLLAVFYQNRGDDYETSNSSLGMQLLGVSGAVFNTEPILMSGHHSNFVGGKFGYLFREGTYYDTGTEDGNRPIVVYKLKKR